MPPAAVFRSRRAVQINSRLPGEDIPVRVRQGVPAIQVAGARIRAVPEVTGDQAALQVLPLAPNERATDLF